jgi:hypothetical protein
VQVRIWYNVPASRYQQVSSEHQGDLSAQNAAKNRERVAKEMTPVQIADAQRRARDWRPSVP